MVYSAATIQWIPEEVGFPKVYNLLKNGGTFAMMMTRTDYKTREFNADEFVLYTGTHSDHIALKEPYRTSFFEGIRTAVLDAGNKITLNDTLVLYLAKKP